MFKGREEVLMAYCQRAQYFEKMFGEVSNWDKEVVQNDPAVKYLNRLLHVYERAIEASKAYGYIGVGSITFAQHRLTRFQERAIKVLA